ncbi:MAG: Nif3-like dinuclear metal center hexameric protein [Actinobacteria bacterium 69-20]|mgnify:FL=1|nr:Nif3-like dinuclear metal center hexameric protein [Actinomycetota bacterium]OJV23114.1 MAG: Nif3-like dinuclear metal center hexameric protein [Actinobacteria bacterium 69-20]
MGVRLAEVLAALDAAYPPRLAEPWDTGIGLTCGDPDDEVRHVLLAVDVDPVTVRQARDVGAQLLVTHHPLLFRPVQSVAASTAKGSLLHTLIRSGIAHVAAHTNADRARGGVNDAFAEALGLVDAVPLVPVTPPALDKVVVFVPVDHADAMVSALAAAGAGTIGDYAEAAFVSAGEGRFTPMPGAHPAIGAVGVAERVAEARVEMVLPPARRADVVAALRAAHPYEEPAFDLYEMAPMAPAGGVREGLGRLGRLPAPMTLSAFTAHVASALPATAWGVRAAGDPDRVVEAVAVCGGAGGSELPSATASGADVYVTSDLSHHVVAEHVVDQARPAVVEVAHWAGEWPWLARAAAVIEAAFGAAVTTTVSTLRTDAWTVHVAGEQDARR